MDTITQVNQNWLQTYLPKPPTIIMPTPTNSTGITPTLPTGNFWQNITDFVVKAGGTVKDIVTTINAKNTQKEYNTLSYKPYTPNITPTYYIPQTPQSSAQPVIITSEGNPPKVATEQAQSSFNPLLIIGLVVIIVIALVLKRR